MEVRRDNFSFSHSLRSSCLCDSAVKKNPLLHIYE
jgi:hypothetical protein